MLDAQEQRSEVARLLQRIDQEYEAAERGLTGLSAGTARHDFLLARQENIGTCHRELQSLVGEHEAMAMIAHHLDSEPEVR